MSISFGLKAELREDVGKGASRRLRRSNRVPAILYGGKDAPQNLTLDKHEVNNNLQHEAFYSHILSLSIGGKKESAVLKDVQRHPYLPKILHMDFQRVFADQELHVNVPLHFVGEEDCVGVKTGGGVISRVVSEVSVACLPKDLPEYLEVDLSELNIGDSLHLSDIKVPAGVTLVELSHGAEHDSAIAAVHLPRAAKEETAAPTDEVASDDAGEEAKPED